ncbi:hypothetical protein [Vibrio atlanticus]|uniref:hypothetical protein n=1 Tax=Vibrio atlanticus TaxID=693153 RepID=UPI00355241F0
MIACRLLADCLAGGPGREYFLEGSLRVNREAEGGAEDETGEKCYVGLSQNIRIETNQ